MTHAKLSPSSATRWTSCTASPSQEAGKPNGSNPASRQGTTEHQVSAECLESGGDPAAYLGRTLYFVCDIEGKASETFVVPEGSYVEHEVTIDDASVARCQAYVNHIRELVVLTGGTLMVEQRLSIEHITGEKGAKGTADAVIFAGEDFIVGDAKFGSGRVNAFYGTEPNKQLAMYASAALEEFGWMGDFKRVRLIIIQPKLNHVSELVLTVDELNAFIETIKTAATATRENPVFVPTSDNCFFCKGRMTCGAREQVVLSTVLGDFDDVTVVKEVDLGAAYSKLGLIAQWCEDIKIRTQIELTEGRPVTGYKLVIGKRGNREWTDPAVVEATLAKCLKPEQLYTQKLIGPAVAEKMVKARKPRNGGEVADAPIGPIVWKSLQELIGQAEGKPEVVPTSDGRPEIVNVSSLFD